MSNRHQSSLLWAACLLTMCIHVQCKHLVIPSHTPIHTHSIRNKGILSSDHKTDYLQNYHTNFVHEKNSLSQLNTFNHNGCKPHPPTHPTNREGIEPTLHFTKNDLHSDRQQAEPFDCGWPVTRLVVVLSLPFEKERRCDPWSAAAEHELPLGQSTPLEDPPSLNPLLMETALCSVLSLHPSCSSSFNQIFMLHDHLPFQLPSPVFQY